MPRRPRIDEPGLIHHVIARGIERRQIFNDDGDAEVFFARLEKLVPDTDTEILAFALIPNHFHLLLRRNGTPISTFMQRLLTSYAIYFNKKYRRSGYLFQNRYKAIPCRDDLHFLELIRYIHLNPVRAGLVGSLEELAGFPFSSHKYILGRNANAWFNPGSVLVHFGSSIVEARKAYQDFVDAGMAAEPSEVGSESRSGADLRIHSPGSRKEQLQQLKYQTARNIAGGIDIDHIISEICSSFSITRAELLGAARRRPVAQARAQLAFRMSKELGFSGSEIGRQLSVGRSAASKMIKKGGEPGARTGAKTTIKSTSKRN